MGITLEHEARIQRLEQLIAALTAKKTLPPEEIPIELPDDPKPVTLSKSHKPKASKK